MSTGATTGELRGFFTVVSLTVLAALVAITLCSCSSRPCSLLNRPQWQEVLSTKLPQPLEIPAEVSALIDEAYDMRMAGRFKDAGSRSEVALHMLEQQCGGDDRSVIFALRSLCADDMPASKDKALYQQRLVKLRDKYDGRNSPESLHEIYLLYGCYSAVDLAATIAYFQDLLAHLDSVKSDRAATIYSCLAAGELRAGNRPAARDHVLCCWSISRNWGTQISVPDSSNYVRATILQQLAFTAENVGEKEIAERCLRIANRILRALSYANWSSQTKANYIMLIDLFDRQGDSVKAAAVVKEARQYLQSLPVLQRQGAGMLYSRMLEFFAKQKHRECDEGQFEKQSDDATGLLDEFDKTVSQAGVDDDKVRLALLKSEDSIARGKQNSQEIRSWLSDAKKIMSSSRFLGEPAKYARRIKEIEQAIKDEATISREHLAVLDRKLREHKADEEAAELLEKELAACTVFGAGKVQCAGVRKRLRLYSRYACLVPPNSARYKTCQIFYCFAEALQELDKKLYDRSLKWWTKCKSYYHSGVGAAGLLEVESWMCYTCILAGRMDAARQHYNVMKTLAPSNNDANLKWYQERYPQIVNAPG